MTRTTQFFFKPISIFLKCIYKGERTNYWPTIESAYPKQYHISLLILAFFVHHHRSSDDDGNFNINERTYSANNSRG